MKGEDDRDPATDAEAQPHSGAAGEDASTPEAEVGDGSSAEQRREATRSSWRRSLDLSAVGIAFPIALIIGFVLGKEAGDALGYPLTGRIVGGVVGALAGFHNLLRQAKRSE